MCSTWITCGPTEQTSSPPRCRCWSSWRISSLSCSSISSRYTHAAQLVINSLCCWSPVPFGLNLLCFSPLCQMRQQEVAGGQPRPILPNGPLAEPSHHHAGHSRTSPLNHTAIRPPCVTQPTANGSCSSSPSVGLSGHLDKNHAMGLGGGGASNRNVPYPQQNSLPHNCTATSHPSTSSTTSSPSHADETWRSQQRNTTTQVSLKFF